MLLSNINENMVIEAAPTVVTAFAIAALSVIAGISIAAIYFVALIAVLTVNCPNPNPNKFLLFC